MMKKRYRAAGLLALLLFPVLAWCQAPADSIFVFRFLPGKDMFFSPALNNGDELKKLLACVERHREKIVNGEIPLYVDGYSNSFKDKTENLSIARIRSRRVKSELITRKGLTEDCFVTHNHAGKGDFVTVCFTLPVDVSRQDQPEIKKTPGTAVTDAGSKKETQAAIKESVTVEENPVTQEVPTEAETVTKEPALPADDYRFSFRANLLRWATLTPDVGFEWRINKDWGIQINCSWTSWSWDGSNRRYAFWEVSPEVRHYIGKEKRGYVGAMYHVGQFNYKLSDTGKQGDLMGGGITGGYQLELNRSLSLDFSLGVGCTHADYEKYTVVDGVRVKRGKENKNYWGVNHAGITLVWKLK